MTSGPVLVVGTGLIGTSIALALRRTGTRDDIYLADRDPATAIRAAALGAGVAELPAQEPWLVVLAVPPGAVPAALRSLQARYPAAAYTDVSSAQQQPQARARELGCDLRRYVGGHPLAGRERSGPEAARAELFVGRPWVLVPLPETDTDTLERARRLAELCGARPTLRTPQEHDDAVALMSHAPQVVASAVAARLVAGADRDLELAGGGVRDLTRIAASDPALWVDILQANAGPVADVLDAVVADLTRTSAALRQLARCDGSGVAVIAELLHRGNAGRRRLETNG